MTDTLNLTS